jgi:hypothetical protein
VKPFWARWRRKRAAGAEARASQAEDRELRALFGSLGDADGIDDARVERVAAAVMRRLPAAKAEPPRLVASYSYRFAAMVVTAAVLGIVVGWYSAAAVDGAARSDLASLLWAPLEHPFEL